MSSLIIMSLNNKVPLEISKTLALFLYLPNKSYTKNFFKVLSIAFSVYSSYYINFYSLGIHSYPLAANL